MRLFLVGVVLAGCSLINEKVFDPQDLAMCVECGDLSQGADLRGVLHDFSMEGDGAVDLENALDLKPMCSAADDCTDPAAPICAGDGGTCRACVNASDDAQCVAHAAGTLCLTEGTSAGRCGDCRPANGTQSGNCASATPVCDVGGSCRKCAVHAECTSGVCNLDVGSCVDSANVLYVNNVTCGAGAKNGSKTDPYCFIQDGVDHVAGSKNVVSVAGTSTAAVPSPYPFVSVNNKTVIIIGPGGTATNFARVSGDTTDPAISVTGNSANVTIDGLLVAGGGTGEDGIACSNLSVGPQMKVVRTVVSGVSGAGMSSSKCNVTFDRDLIAGAGGGGVSIANAQYSITNCFVQKGLSALQAGVSLDPGGTDAMHVFQHNTVVYNTNTGGIGGINVKSGTAKIENSIILGNTQVTNTQMSGSATFNATFVDIDDSSTPSGSGNVNLPPEFVSASPGPNFDFHLSGRTTANNMCCIDKISSSPVDHDYDGRARPQPAAGMFDVGAHEVP
jgi:hypothetical protein